VTSSAGWTLIANNGPPWIPDDSADSISYRLLPACGARRFYYEDVSVVTFFEGYDASPEEISRIETLTPGVLVEPGTLITYGPHLYEPITICGGFYHAHQRSEVTVSAGAAAVPSAYSEFDSTGRDPCPWGAGNTEGEYRSIHLRGPDSFDD